MTEGNAERSNVAYQRAQKYFKQLTSLLKEHGWEVEEGTYPKRPYSLWLCAVNGEDASLLVTYLDSRKDRYQWYALPPPGTGVPWLRAGKDRWMTYVESGEVGSGGKQILPTGTPCECPKKYSFPTKRRAESAMLDFKARAAWKGRNYEIHRAYRCREDARRFHITSKERRRKKR